MLLKPKTCRTRLACGHICGHCPVHRGTASCRHRQPWAVQERQASTSQWEGASRRRSASGSCPASPDDGREETVIWNDQFLPKLLLPRAFYPRNRMKVGHRARQNVTLTALRGQTERTEGHSPDRRQHAHFLFILAFKPWYSSQIFWNN